MPGECHNDGCGNAPPLFMVVPESGVGHQWWCAVCLRDFLETQQTRQAVFNL